MSEVYELWEADTVGRKLLKKSDEKQNIEDARNRAKELTRAWCEDEEPSAGAFAKGVEEFWAGNSDFGIVIVRRVKS